MEFKEAKNKYIQTWGALGSQWGINKTMAQIHALLMISIEPLSIEEIMDELQISRGNTSMNIRALIDWGIVFKESKSGERKFLILKLVILKIKNSLKNKLKNYMILF